MAERDEKTDKYVAPKKGNLKLRAKKFFASKTAGTKLGQKIINSFLGPNGEKIVTILTAVACKLHGKKDAKAAQTDLYKIATKFKISMDEKKLDLESVDQGPMNELGVQILDVLSMERKVPKIKIDTIMKNIGYARSAANKLMKGNLQEKNFKKLQGLFDLYGGVEFFQVVLNDPTHKEEKSELFESLSIVMKDQLLELERIRSKAKPKLCELYSCNNPRVEAFGAFLGSRFCAYHHQRRYVDKIDAPKLSAFLMEADSATTYFVEFLTSLDEKQISSHRKSIGNVNPVNLFHFLRAANAYEKIDRTLRDSRAQAIIRKYLYAGKPSYIGTDKKLLDEILETMDGANDAEGPRSLDRRQSLAYRAPPREIFQKATKLIYDRLDDVFKNAFLKSKVYAKYLLTVTLPEAAKKLAEVQKIEKEKLDKLKKERREKLKAAVLINK